MNWASRRRTCIGRSNRSSTLVCSSSSRTTSATGCGARPRRARGARRVRRPHRPPPAAPLTPERLTISSSWCSSRAVESSCTDNHPDGERGRGRRRGPRRPRPPRRRSRQQPGLFGGSNLAVRVVQPRRERRGENPGLVLPSGRVPIAREFCEEQRSPLECYGEVGRAGPECLELLPKVALLAGEASVLRCIVPASILVVPGPRRRNSTVTCRISGSLCAPQICGIRRSRPRGCGAAVRSVTTRG